MTSPEQPGEGRPEERGQDEPEHDHDEGAASETGAPSGEQGPSGQQAPAEEPSSTQADAEGSPESTEQAESAEQAESTEQAESAEQAEEAPAKKRRTGLIVGIAAAVVVVLVGGGVGAFFAFFAGDSAKEVAEKYVAVATKETQNPGSVTAADYRPIVCKKSMPQVEQMQKRKEQVLKSVPPQALEKVKKVKTSLKKVDTKGDTGKATFETAFPGQPPQQAELKLIKEDGGWQLCG